MKRLALAALLLWGASAPLTAATRTDVNVLEATEGIRYLSQEITKSYLYLYANPKKREVAQQIRQQLNELVEDIRIISISTNDEDTRTVLEFLVYSKDQIEELVKEKPDKEKAALMLDYSETLLEGANSIARAHSYTFSESEKMLMKGKRIEYLLERAAKYYLALGIGLGSEINRKQMRQSVEALEENVRELEAYDYPTQMKKNQLLLRQSWEVAKSLFDREKEMFVSNLVLLSGNEVERITGEFILYHRKAK
jgi:hypothetical protein